MNWPNGREVKEHTVGDVCTIYRRRPELPDLDLRVLISVVEQRISILLDDIKKIDSDLAIGELKNVVKRYEILQFRIKRENPEYFIWYLN